MGEAARRKAQIEALKARNGLWLASLSPEERTIAEISQATYDSVVVGLGMTEGCYNLAFFLHEYLRRRHGIMLKIVVGWVNDGLWEGATSHAWVEYLGKKIDISLYKTTYPDLQAPGDLIILDHIAKRGEATYVYWPTLPDAAERALNQMSNESPEFRAIVAHKVTEHQRILELSSKQDGVYEYFRQAPSSHNYEFLASSLESRRAP